MVGAGPVGRLRARQRIRKRSDFRRIQSRGRRVVTPHFVFLLQAGDANAPARLGITASRKVGNAVVRNRSKRLVREAFRATRALWPSGISVVIIVKRSLGVMKLAEVVSEWQRSAAAFDKAVRLARSETEAPGLTQAKKGDGLA